MLERKHAVLVVLALAVVLSLYTHSIIWQEWYYPTYGNTNVHVAFAKHILSHWEYPLGDDYSYGGGIPTLYVPGYRLVLAGTMAIVGSADLAQRLLVMLFALMLPVGFFLFAREVYGKWAGVAAAFAASFPAELLIYTVRPLPQAMGMALLPFALYAIASGRKKLALALSLAIALTHQETAVFLAMGAFAFGVGKTFIDFLKTKKVVLKGAALTALLAWSLTTVAYVGWHYVAIGDLNVFDIAQFHHHEGNVVEWQSFVDKTGLVLISSSLLGLLVLVWNNLSKQDDAQLLAIAFAIVGIAAIKNDLVGIRVFMDRFIAYLQIPMVVLAGVAIVWVLVQATQFTRKTLFPKLSE